jgi:hypothetical protein
MENPPLFLVSNLSRGHSYWELFKSNRHFRNTDSRWEE